MKNLLRCSGANVIDGQSIELTTAYLPTIRKVLAKALWLKENAAETSNNFTSKSRLNK